MEMNWITAISQLYSQIMNLFGNAILKLIHIRLFDLLTRCHYILNPLVYGHIPRNINNLYGHHQQQLDNNNNSDNNNYDYNINKNENNDQ